MRSPFWKFVLVMFALVLAGVGITIACRAGTSLETMVPPAVAAPPPAPTELPPAEKEVAERAKQYLREHAAEYSLRADLSDLKVSRVTKDAGEYHIWFQQIYQGILVYGEELGVHIREDGKASPRVTGSTNPHIVVRDVTPPYPGPNGSVPTLTPKLSANDALTKGLVALNVKGQLMKQATPELVLYPVGRVGFNMQYALAWRMTLHALNPPGDWDVVVDALTGETLRTYNLRPSPMSRNSPAPNASTSVPKEPSPTSPPRVAQATPIPKTNPTPSKQPESAIIAKPLQPSGTATANVPPRPPRPAPVQSSNGLPLHPDHKIFPGKRISNSVSQQTTLTTTSGWNTLMTEGFEGVWPTGAWWVSADPTWDDESYRPHTGSWSAWCAGSTLNPAYDQYPNNMNAWAVYGSFNLSDATAADFNSTTGSSLNRTTISSLGTLRSTITTITATTSAAIRAVGNSSISI